MHAQTLSPIGAWRPGTSPASFSPQGLVSAVARVREPAHVVRDGASGPLGVAFGGEPCFGEPGDAGLPLMASLPALYPEWLGDRSFLEVHGLRFPYVGGAMANGIASPTMVIALGRAGMLGVFGSAGLSLERVEKGLEEIERGLTQGEAWGSNLIHSPHEPELEEALVALYLRRGVRRVSASAYMRLTPAVVRYAASGLVADPSGRIQRPNLILAKISRPEVARRFLSPAPPKILEALVAQGKLSATEAALAARLPLAEDVTVEADSGGHTDNRPLPALFPTIAALRDEIMGEQAYARPIRLGAAGGLGTPAAVAAAFTLGAAYALTGSVNQATREAGLSEEGKALLAQAGIADVMMAPAADMFEMGVKVQVLKRGTLFGVRALKLYEIYRTHDSLETLDASERARLEKEILGQSVDEVWEATRQFFSRRNPGELEKAEREPKHKMALVFRWYLGSSSRWPIEGLAERRGDYQIWCGPAMGAFNAWTAGSFLAEPNNRGVVQIGLNLLEGAAVVTRAQQFRSYGVPMPPAAFSFAPRPLS